MGLRPTQGDEEWPDTTLLACQSSTVQQVPLTAPAGRGSEKQLISQQSRDHRERSFPEPSHIRSSTELISAPHLPC